MGYSAMGNGSANFKEGVDVKELERILEELDTDIEYDIIDTYIYFSECDSHWQDYNTEEFLDVLIPFIEDGCAEYSGDEDAHWRYCFNKENQKWIEECGKVVYNFESYSDDELIKEVIRRGYTVSPAV